jgi:hypothetical protein
VAAAARPLALRRRTRPRSRSLLARASRACRPSHGVTRPEAVAEVPDGRGDALRRERGRCAVPSGPGGGTRASSSGPGTPPGVRPLPPPFQHEQPPVPPRGLRA